MATIKCACGFENKENQKFCSECGSLLSKSVATSSVQAPSESEKKPEPVNVYPEDKDLKLMLDWCKTVGPLVTGTRYDELVLYYDEKNNSFQIHKYANSGIGSAVHEGYYTSKEHADRIMSTANVGSVLKYGNFKNPLMGGSVVFKFRNAQDEIVRLENYNSEVYAVVSDVLVLFGEGIKSENRIIPEYARSWKSFSVVSTGMSTDNCYSFFLERYENGRTSVKGRYFTEGKKKEISKWKTLSASEEKKLDGIPLGLLLSKVVVTQNQNPMMGFFPMANDMPTVSVSITYEDGKTDSKIPDDNILGELKELLSNII